MMHQDIYKQFELCFPDYGKNIEMWFPNGRNSVRIRQVNKQEFIFTYNGQDDWKFETVKSFLDGMKGAKR